MHRHERALFKVLVKYEDLGICSVDLYGYIISLSQLSMCRQ